MHAIARLHLEEPAPSYYRTPPDLVRKRLLNYIEVPVHIRETDTSNSIKMVLDSPRISSTTSRKWVRQISPITPQRAFAPVPFTKPPLKVAMNSSFSKPPPAPKLELPSDKPRKKPKLAPRCLCPFHSQKSVLKAVKYLRQTALKLARLLREDQAPVTSRQRFPSGSQSSTSTDYGSPLEKVPAHNKVKCVKSLNDPLSIIRRMRRSESLQKEEAKKRPPKKLSINLQPCYSAAETSGAEGEKKRRFTEPGQNVNFAAALEKLALDPVIY